MSFMNLKSFLPPRKMWKKLKNKLQKNLHKLNRSKPMMKPRFQTHINSKRLVWPSLSIRQKKFKPKLSHPSIHLQKRTPPVYVDQLFIEHVPVSRTREPKPGNEIVATSDHEKSNSLETLGINERAEEFIAKFRTQMRHQELLDRHLL